MDFTKKELEILIIGIRLQLDECTKNKTHYDNDIRVIYIKKEKELYELWKKLEQNG